MRKPAFNISSPKGRVRGLFVPNVVAFTIIGNLTGTSGNARNVVTGQV